MTSHAEVSSTKSDAGLGPAFKIGVVTRGVLAGFAVVHNLLVAIPGSDHPWGVLAVCVFILGWTVLVSWLLCEPSRRAMWVYVLDTLATAAVVAATGWLTSPEVVPATLAGYWIAGSAIYAAMFRSTKAGLMSAVPVLIVFLAVPPGLTIDRIFTALLVLLLIGCLGTMVSRFRAALTEREVERNRTVALAERQRLARVVHDGALQVLTLVERECPSFGPRGQRLATLARESESQLRSLLRDRDVAEETPTTLVDLAGALDKYQSARVTVSTMAGQVMASHQIVTEVEATLVEILTNVERHAGENAQAWILLDQETGDEVILWIRDNGVGMSPNDALEAAQRGRFGIRDSIVGRMSALGGSAMLKSTPGLGTEWELRFPIDGGEAS